MVSGEQEVTYALDKVRLTGLRGWEEEKAFQSETKSKEGMAPWEAKRCIKHYTSRTSSFRAPQLVNIASTGCFEISGT